MTVLLSQRWIREFPAKLERQSTIPSTVRLFFCMMRRGPSTGNSHDGAKGMQWNLNSWVPVSSRSTGWIERWFFFWRGDSVAGESKTISSHQEHLDGSSNGFSLPIKAWTIRESNAEILLGATWLIMRQGWSTHQAISKNTPLILLYQTCFFPRKHGTKCVFILRFSSTSAYGILDSDSRATGVTWCYTLKTRLDVRASACIAALAMLLVPGCFGFY